MIPDLGIERLDGSSNWCEFKADECGRSVYVGWSIGRREWVVFPTGPRNLPPVVHKVKDPFLLLAAVHDIIRQIHELNP